MLPQIPGGNYSASNGRRKGWWDNACNKAEAMKEVKELLRNTNTVSHDLNNPYTPYYSSSSASPPIAPPAAEEGLNSSAIHVEIENYDYTHLSTTKTRKDLELPSISSHLKQQVSSNSHNSNNNSRTRKSNSVDQTLDYNHSLGLKYTNPIESSSLRQASPKTTSTEQFLNLQKPQNSKNSDSDDGIKRLKKQGHAHMQQPIPPKNSNLGVKLMPLDTVIPQSTYNREIFKHEKNVIVTSLKNEDSEIGSQNSIKRKQKKNVRPEWDSGNNGRYSPSLVHSTKDDEVEVESLQIESTRQSSFVHEKQRMELLNQIGELIESESIKAVVDSWTILRHLLDIGMYSTFDAFAKESNTESRKTNHLKLFHFMQEFKFQLAFQFVKCVSEDYSEKNYNSGSQFQRESNLSQSFDDLLYVLGKYMLIHQIQQNSVYVQETLAIIIWPMIQKEQDRNSNSARKDWFLKDFQDLSELASGNYKSGNPYIDFDWKEELSNFWKSLNMGNDGQMPLFAYALDAYFGGSSLNSKGEYSLDEMAVRSKKIQLIQDRINHESKAKPIRPPTAKVVENPRSKRYKAIQAKEQQNQYTEISEAPNLNANVVEFPPVSSMRNGSGKRRAPLQYVSSSSVSDGSARYSQTGNGGAQFSLEYQGPPLSNESENSAFALAGVCGPSSSSIRVMDVNHIPETGQFIVATSGGDDRDRLISFWDVKADKLVCQLDNTTSKPIVALIFHPSFPELLLSADMTGDVKLWNWNEERMVRNWKRHHSRIIYQLGYVPGDDTRAVSCSGDQSLKIWNIHSDSSQRGSIHANEPITSFSFVGSETDPQQQKIVVSLSCSLRIYKLRTLQLIHSISLKDELQRVQISFITPHPRHDNFILISSDHQLRLFDLNTEKNVRSYTARKAGMRLKGSFSPCGNYIYAGTFDPRAHKDDIDEITGHLIWKVNSGRLEIQDIDAMDVSGWEHRGQILAPTPTTACIWTNFTQGGKRKGTRKVFLSAGIRDKLIRMYF